nr:Maternal Effect Lethal family member (mel 32) [Hymenolepis microstoma]
MSVSFPSLECVDPEIYKLCKDEESRQRSCIELIASENFASKAVLSALSSTFHNKYSEGVVGARYYGGVEFVDAMETICKERALKLFGLSPYDWGVNVQPYSGSPANMAVYMGLVGPHGRIMGLNLPDGGHLTHGFFTPMGKKISASSLFFESLPYCVDSKTGLIDFETLGVTVKLFRPRLLVVGASAYPRILDYGRFKKIADSVGALMMVDIAHISGLISSGIHPSPFEYADVVTTTTHKTLRAARGAMIYYRLRKPAPPSKTKGAQNGTTMTNGSGPVYVQTDFKQRIDDAVFPGLQGGPHNNSIAAIAVGLQEALQPTFSDYIHKVVMNSKRLANKLQGFGYTITTGGTDTHLFLMDFRPLKLDGVRVSTVLEAMGITTNKNTVPGDVSALRPSGIRIGTPAVTTRGFGLEDMDIVAEFIHAGIQIALKVASGLETVAIKDFEFALINDAEARSEILKWRKEVVEFALRFPLPTAF